MARGHGRAHLGLGTVWAYDARTGALRWLFATPAPIKYPPAIAGGRAYFGSGDGYAGSFRGPARLPGTATATAGTAPTPAI